MMQSLLRLLRSRTPDRPKPIPSCQLRLECLENRLAPAMVVPTGFSETLVADNIPGATAMEIAPDGRIFVAEQTGNVQIIKNNTLLPTPFVSLTVDFSGERGLLGIAFDPNFTVNHFVYLYHTVPGSPAHNQVSRFTANGDVAPLSSEDDILNLPNLGPTNHNGGSIHFGLDGKLYIGVGENGNGTNSQDLSSPLGKMLRINPDGSIPMDNPFTNTPGADPAVWALGLRNPFTFAVQPATGPDPGRIFINDVGFNSWEEIDKGIAGANYGWPAREGFHPGPGPFSTTGPVQDPIFEYGHGIGPTTGNTIVGGTFYDPANGQFPSSYVGQYFFSDLASNWIRVLNPADNSVTGFASGQSATVDLKVDANGSLLVLSRGNGAVYKIQFASTFPLGRAVQSVASVNAGGHQVIYALTQDQGILQHEDATGWNQIANPGTTLSISATTENGHAVVFALTTDHQILRRDDGGGWNQVAGPGSTLSMATATENGHAVVFALDPGNGIQRLDTGSAWNRIASPGTTRSISATTENGHAVVFAVTGDFGILRRDIQSGWDQVAGPFSALSVSAVTDSSGHTVVFAVTGDHAIVRYDFLGNMQQIASPWTTQFITTTVDENGHAVVFAITGDDQLLRYDDGAGWVGLAGPWTTLTDSAVDDAFNHAVVYAVTGEHRLLVYVDQTGNGQAV